MRCRSPSSRGARSGGRGLRWAGRLRLGPGNPRRDSHLPRAPAGLASPYHGEWFGWELSKDARPFPLGWRRLGPARRGRCKSFHLCLGILLVLSRPPPQPPLTPCREETRRAGGGGGIGMRLWRSRLLATNCAKFCLPGRERGAETGRGGGRQVSADA